MKKCANWVAIIVFLIVGLTIGGLYDLSINKAIYNPQNYFAIFMEAVGYWPLYLPLALLFGVYAKCDKRYKKISGTILCAIVFIVLCFLGIRYTNHRGIAPYMVLASLALCAGLLALILYKKDLQTLKKLWFIGCVGSAYTILNNVFIVTIKLIWRRPRFDDMLSSGSLDAFEPWYNIWGPGGSSFPSAHTGAACGIFVLLCLCSLFEFWRKKHALLLAICFSYIGLMAYARLIVGRHFFSDTVAAAAIGYIVFISMQHTSVYKKALAHALKPVGDSLK